MIFLDPTHSLTPNSNSSENKGTLTFKIAMEKGDKELIYVLSHSSSNKYLHLIVPWSIHNSINFEVVIFGLQKLNLFAKGVQ